MSVLCCFIGEKMMKEFLFGERGEVRAGKRYAPGGFGFVTERERLARKELRIHELNGGFDVPYWYWEEVLTQIEENQKGCFVNSDVLMRTLEEKDEASYGRRYLPLCFKLTVPEAGNYRVSMTVCAQEEEPEIILFAGRRHLIWKGCLQPGQQLYKTFTVNVCDIIPTCTGAVYEDRTLDIAVIGRCPVLQRVTVEKVDCPTVWLAGDSTMVDAGADYPYHPAACYAGWGQAFDAWQNGGVAICNQAHNGRTTETFRTEGHFDIVKKYIRPGDFFLIQFGHNDQKHGHLQVYNGYPENIIRFVEEIRQRGGLPMILTPIARNTWKGEETLTYNDLLCDYAQACLHLGEKLNVPVLDLHKDSMTELQRLGRESSKAWYHEDDWTHNNDYGAYRAAGYVASELKKIETTFQEYLPLIKAVDKGCGEWKPETAALLKKPRRFSEKKDPWETEEEPLDHQAEKSGDGGLTRLLEAIRQAQAENCND